MRQRDMKYKTAAPRTAFGDTLHGLLRYRLRPFTMQKTVFHLTEERLSACVKAVITTRSDGFQHSIGGLSHDFRRPNIAHSAALTT